MKYLVLMIVGVIVLGGVVFGVYWLVTEREMGVAGEEVEGLEGIRPRDMKIIEVGDEYFVVEWEVERSVSGYVKYGDTSTGVNLIAQDLDGAVPSKKHTVRVSGLIPGKKYYFWVMSDEIAFGRNGRALEVLTVSD